ncbi:MAG: ferrous iron transport protein A [Acidobacteria bacterium]|nr:ferrous iron transport protein A [Acidobacteriota bacterium]
MVPPATSVESPRSTVVAVPLTTVPVGAVAKLHEVTDVDSRPVLRSLGLTDDCVLRLCQVGDPCIVQVKSTRIGLSNAVARCLYVVPEAGNR